MTTDRAKACERYNCAWCMNGTANPGDWLDDNGNCRDCGRPKKTTTATRTANQPDGAKGGGAGEMHRLPLPCPHCGFNFPTITEARGEHWVQCMRCDSGSGMRPTREAAIVAWNRRAPVSAATPIDPDVVRYLSDLFVSVGADPVAPIQHQARSIIKRLQQAPVGAGGEVDEILDQMIAVSGNLAPNSSMHRALHELVAKAKAALAKGGAGGEGEVERVARAIYLGVQTHCPTKMDDFDDPEQREFYMNVARETIAALARTGKGEGHVH